MNRLQSFTCLDESNAAAWPDDHPLNAHGSRYSGYTPVDPAAPTSRTAGSKPVTTEPVSTRPHERFEMT